MGLEKVMHPASVAVIGASKVETKRGYQAIRTLMDEKYEGRIYPINPKEESILGFKCYPSVSSITDLIDVALIATPAATVPDILQECGRKKIAGAVILAGGFRESGEKGRELEEKIVSVARLNNIRIIGPNTSGMLNLVDNLNLVGIKNVPKGNIALLSQSGNMALSLITEAKLKSRKGFSYYVGVGNEADIKFHEYLEFFKQDPSTNAILMYVEGMRDGRKFLQQAYLTTEQKPIVLLKGGRSVTGKRSAGSHTGAMAGMSRVAKGAFQRAGIIVIDNSDELFPVAETLSSCPALRNNKVAILADGGGHATIAADILTDYGIQIPELGEKTQTKLGQILPKAASVTNPVDVAGGTDADPSIFADCARIILKDPNVGGLLLVGLFGGYGIRFAESLSLKEEDAAHQMGKMMAKGKKPIVIHSLFNSERPHSLELCRYYGIPVYDSLDVASRCIAALAQYGNYVAAYHSKTNFVLDYRNKNKPKAMEIIDNAKKAGRRNLLETEAKHILSLHGVPVVAENLAESVEEAVALASKVSGAVALKVVSEDILHKSDAGGVRLNLTTNRQVGHAYHQIMRDCREYAPDAHIRGILVSPMVPMGLEVIIGTKIDAQFGPIIMYGLGGVMVEILKDVSFRVLPISRHSARKMIEETQSSPILKGVRGNPPYDQKALVKLLITVSEIVEAYPEIEEMDFNPVIVHTEGLSVVDARIILKSASSPKPHNGSIQTREFDYSASH